MQAPCETAAVYNWLVHRKPTTATRLRFQMKMFNPEIAPDFIGADNQVGGMFGMFHETIYNKNGSERVINASLSAQFLVLQQSRKVALSPENQKRVSSNIPPTMSQITNATTVV